MREASISLLFARALARACCKLIWASPKTPTRAGRRKGRTGGTSVGASCAWAYVTGPQGTNSVARARIRDNRRPISRRLICFKNNRCILRVISRAVLHRLRNRTHRTRAQGAFPPEDPLENRQIFHIVEQRIKHGDGEQRQQQAE